MNGTQAAWRETEPDKGEPVLCGAEGRGLQSLGVNPSYLLTSHCDLGKLINLSMVWFLRFLNEGNKIYFTHTHTHSLKQFLEQNKYKYQLLLGHIIKGLEF